MEGLLYEGVITALGCGAVWDGKGAARYYLRVLVMDQVPYGPYVPVRQPVVLPLHKSATIPPSRQEYLSDAAQEYARIDAADTLRGAQSLNVLLSRLGKSFLLLNRDLG